MVFNAKIALRDSRVKRVFGIPINGMRNIPQASVPINAPIKSAE